MRRGVVGPRIPSKKLQDIFTILQFSLSDSSINDMWSTPGGSSGEVNSVVLDLRCFEWFCWWYLFVTGHGPEMASEVCNACPCTEGKRRSLPNEFIFHYKQSAPSFSKLSGISWDTRNAIYLWKWNVRMCVTGSQMLPWKKAAYIHGWSLPLNLITFSAGP